MICVHLVPDGSLLKDHRTDKEDLGFRFQKTSNLYFLSI